MKIFLKLMLMIMCSSLAINCLAKSETLRELFEKSEEQIQQEEERHEKQRYDAFCLKINKTLAAILILYVATEALDAIYNYFSPASCDCKYQHFLDFSNRLRNKLSTQK